MKRYSDAEKRKLLRRVALKVQNGKSIENAIREVGIGRGSYYKWAAEQPEKLTRHEAASMGVLVQEAEARRAEEAERARAQLREAEALTEIA